MSVPGKEGCKDEQNLANLLIFLDSDEPCRNVSLNVSLKIQSIHLFAVKPNLAHPLILFFLV